MKILVRGPNWLGDAIFARSFYKGLRAHYERSEIVLLSHPRALGAGEHEWFDRTLTLSDPSREDFGLFDLGITLPASLSSAFQLWSAGIPYRVGFAELSARAFLTTAIPWQGRRAGVHKAELYLDLLEVLTGKRYPLERPASTQTKREKLILVGPGASLPLREWPYFFELCEKLPDALPDFSFELVGAPADTKWKTVLARSSNSKRWKESIGETTLDQLKEKCSSASLVIANDTGLAHVAATVCGAPTLVLFGPGDPRYVLPRGEKVDYARSDIPCSPCESARCRAPFGYQKCLRSLSVTSVLDHARRTLSL